MRYKRIHDFTKEVIKPLIVHMKKIKKTERMPWKEIETILKLLYPETKQEEVGKGFFKHVYVIHTNTRWLVLKICRRPEHLKKDYKVYRDLPRSTRNRYYAKIYWATDIFMLQKWGEKTEVPREEVMKLKAWGRKQGLKDIRPANIMKVDGRFKIVDAEKI